MAKASRIVDLAREAKRGILEGQTVKVVSLLADIMLKAKEIEQMMREAKRGKE